MTATPSKRTLLGDPRLRRELVEMVRRRVPADEVEDVVQATLTEALASTSAPDTLEDLRRWVWGIARHKVADLHRKQRREAPAELGEVEDERDDGHEAGDLLRWAERELPEGDGAKQTLGWLLREGEGEKLEHIAAAENLPAPRVRQRVTRLRQHFRARWQAHLAAVATLVGVGVLFWWWLRPRPAPEPPIVRDAPSALPTSPDPSHDRARELRRLALEDCAKGDYDRCLRALDEAAGIDPTGDSAPEVVAARRAAASRPAPTATSSDPPTPDSKMPTKKGPSVTPPPPTGTTSASPVPSGTTFNQLGPSDGKGSKATPSFKPSPKETKESYDSMPSLGDYDSGARSPKVAPKKANKGGEK